MKSPNASMLYRYRFGTAEFDEARFELRVAGLPVELQRKPLEVLALLLARAGEVVTREELFEAIWDNRPTVEHVIANAIAKLRSALGDQSAELIVTHPRVGYRLTGKVERVAVGRALSSRLELREGDPVPGRANFRLRTLLSASPNSEVWIARQEKSSADRVFKFALAGARLSALKREATLFRVLHDEIGPRDDITRVLDWNFETEPFFLECEYGGVSLGEWATGNLAILDRTQRIAFFLQIADAVAAAHSVGVLHKDLKPANVLVGRASTGDWQIKLTDFGSGRLLEPERLEALGITSLGFTLTQAASADTSGTPLYLAPELIALQPPTIKTDVYALGLILYQIVIGDLRKPLVPGWQRDIHDELLLEDISAATDGNPDHRLGSVAELVDRLRRLEARRLRRREQAVLAAESATLLEAVRRSRVRRPWIVATIAVLVVGLAVTYRSEQALLAQKDVVEHLNRFLIEDFIGAADPVTTGRAQTTVADAAKAAAQRIDVRFAQADPEIRAALHKAMQEVYFDIDDPRESLAQGRRALSEYHRLARPDTQAIWATKLRMAQAYASTGETRIGEDLLAEMQQELQAAGVAKSELQLRLWHVLAILKKRSGQVRESSVILDDALMLARQLPDTDPMLIENLMYERAAAHTQLGQQDEAEQLLRQLIAHQTARGLPPQDVPLNKARSLLGMVLAQKNQLDEATSLLADAVEKASGVLGSSSSDVMTMRNRLVNVLVQRKDYARAAEEGGALYREAVAKGLPSRSLVYYQTSYGVALEKLGRNREALPVLREALVSARDVQHENGPWVQQSRFYLAECLLNLGEADEAEKLLVGLDAKVMLEGDSDPDWQARLDFQQGRIALLRGHPRKALDQFEKIAARISPRVSEHTGLADLMMEVRASMDRATAAIASESRRADVQR